ncbi:Hypothetical protein, predicted transmembrane protein [Mycoplasmopsis bovigenitalium 51080]|uniref:Uncharacterized protein n=1 Tax=Mycoplasmopsis bovigenitalium 51080 TaxID=1188235 RepID=N9TS80_9BACT|nr:hypothetical protein [Mycoplasmopsis bovigenitalium]ENY69014.1 Hypothetical protein, predicted transmembrane protein [Mycoplasmopsis bovigenitalium 51080]
MAVGHVNLDIKLRAKNLNAELGKIEKQFQSTVSGIKNMLIASKLGSFLLAGANDSINQYMTNMRLLAGLSESGLGKENSTRLLEIADGFENIGYNAEMAADSFNQFIITGKATVLQSIGIYLDQNQKSILATATAQDRLNWVMSEGNKKMQEQAKNMPEHIRNQLELRKAIDDTKKALGSSFLQVINNMVNALGGLGNALRIAIAAFAAYKIAMIIGNVAIGISKAIALGSVFSAPIAIAMGVGALASIGALIGAAGLAFSSIPNSDNSSKQDVNVDVSNDIVINVSSDRYGREIVQGGGK